MRFGDDVLTVFDQLDSETIGQRVARLLTHRPRSVGCRRCTTTLDCHEKRVEKVFDFADGFALTEPSGLTYLPGHAKENDARTIFACSSRHPQNTIDSKRVPHCDGTLLGGNRIADKVVFAGKDAQ